VIGVQVARAAAGGDTGPYADDAVLETPLGHYEGPAAIARALGARRRLFPGLRAALHDEFTSADGTRACLRLRLTWANGSSAETHALALRDGRVVEQILGVSTFDMAKVLLADLGLDFPRDRPDTRPEIDPGDGATLARRFVRAFDARDLAAFDELCTSDVAVYTPLGWPIAGLDAVKGFVDEFHAANPGLRVTLHDEFASADGTRVCWRVRLHFHNTAPFFGNPPTGERGVMSETHSITVRDGRIARFVVGDNLFVMPHQELVTWKMDFPAGTQDPDPELAPPG
jgi:ketosteroid isomerase-like protein